MPLKINLPMADSETVATPATLPSDAVPSAVGAAPVVRGGPAGGQAASRPFSLSRWLTAVLHAARPRQWLKSLLVFAAPLAGATTGRPDGLAYAVAACVAFGCASASVYYVNDVMDAERDREHPVKCTRPIASGELPVRDAIVIAVTLASLVVGYGFAIGTPLLSAVTGGYLVSSTFYSTRGKHHPYLEMLLVASGFVLRVLAGAVATHVPPSHWFLGVCSLGALSVTVAKRYTELSSLGTEAVKHRPVTRFYKPAALRAIQVILAAGMVATYVMWAAGGPAGGRYWHIASALPLALALTRFGMLTGRRTVRPVEDMLTHDGLMLACEAAWLTLFMMGLYLLSGRRPAAASRRKGRGRPGYCRQARCASLRLPQIRPRP
jgi:decaprenyl-phosphate phosphoribosyltransferase